MDDLVLFQAALGLVEPWKVVGVAFDSERRRLDLRIDFAKGARFECPECGAGGCKVHDTEQKTRRHLNFFEHEAYLTARVPRVICAEHGVKQVVVPWARERSDFTLLFEALVMALVKEMPVNAIAELIGEHDTKLWRVVNHYVDAAVEAQDLSGMQTLGLDDTSFRRGQDYVTVFADLAVGERRAVFVVEGRDQVTIEQFKGFLVEHDGDPASITEVCQDMSAAYLAGVREHLPQAQVTFDRYHVKQKLRSRLRDDSRVILPVAGASVALSLPPGLRHPRKVQSRPQALLRRPVERKQSILPNNYYFYIRDRNWGPSFIKNAGFRLLFASG